MTNEFETLANKVVAALNKRKIPNFQGRQPHSIYRDKTEGQSTELGNISDYPQILIAFWNDKLVDGETKRNWLGFGSISSNEKFKSFVAGMSTFESDCLHFTERDLTEEKPCHWKTPFLESHLLRPVLEIYPEKLSGFGIHQLRNEQFDVFLERSLDFVERSLLTYTYEAEQNNLTDAELRDKAIEASKPTPTRGISISNYYKRSATIRAWVLRRANGVCEACGQKGFITLNNKPFLEAHHLERLSDDGPDDHKSVAGLCPNCHREIHYGKDGQKINEKARETVKRKEACFD